MKKYLIIILVILTSCVASKPRVDPWERPVTKEKVIEKSFEITWQKLIDYFGSHNIPIKTIDKSSGILSTEYDLRTGTENNKGMTNYCDCGTLGTDMFYTYKYENYKGNFNIIVNKINDNQTKVKINAFFNANYNYYHNEGKGYEYKLEIVQTDKVKCESIGYLEKEVFEFIK